MTLREVNRRMDFDIGLLANPNDVPEALDGDSPGYQQAIAGNKAYVAKMNTSHFFAYLYTQVRGGMVAPQHRKKVSLTNGNGRHEETYMPDVLHRGWKGCRDVEVKAFCNSLQGGIPCRRKQFGNYWGVLLDRFEKNERGDTSLESDKIGFEYAFFRYGSPVTYRPVNGGKSHSKIRDGAGPAAMAPWELINYLGDNIRDLLIVPPNVLMLMLANSNNVSLTRSDNGNGEINVDEYFHVKSGDISELHNLNHGGIEGLLARHNDRFVGVGRGAQHVFGFNHSDFGLAEWQIYTTQFRTPTILVNKKHTIRPFKVTRYKLNRKSYLEWMQFAIKNRDIIERALGIEAGIEAEDTEDIPI